MGGLFSSGNSGSYHGYNGTPFPNPIQRATTGNWIYAVFMLILSLGLMGISAVSLAYIEETKGLITDPNISQGMIQTSEASGALSLIVSLIVLISSVFYIQALRKSG